MFIQIELAAPFLPLLLSFFSTFLALLPCITNTETSAMFFPAPHSFPSSYTLSPPLTWK